MLLTLDKSKVNILVLKINANGTLLLLANEAT